MQRLATRITRAASLLLIAAAACSSSADDATGLARQSATADVLDLSARVTPEEFSPGDTATITVALTNTADTAVTLQFGSSCQLYYTLFDDAGSEVPQEGGGYGCFAAITHLRLAAGETVEQHFPWTAAEYHYPPYARAYLPDGDYRVRGLLFDHPDRDGALSEPVSVRVRNAREYGARSGVAVSVSGAPSRIGPSDTAWVEVRAENTADTAVTMRFRSGCQFLYRIASTAAGVSGATWVGEGCAQDVVSSLRIAAGATERRLLPLTREVRDALTGELVVLPPGSYGVHGALGAPYDPALTSPITFVQLTP